MMIYHRFRKDFGWHPRDVDRLSRAELFWLPVISAAEVEAAETLARAQARDLKSAAREKSLLAFVGLAGRNRTFNAMPLSPAPWVPCGAVAGTGFEPVTCGL